MLVLSLTCCVRESWPPSNNYAQVGKMMDTIKAPYIIDLKNHRKRLILIGCDHVRDTNHPQFQSIKVSFKQIVPQIAFNEGGQLPDSIHFNNMNEAIEAKGETGALKYLSDSSGIAMINGDVADSTEFSIMLKRYSVDELLLYYMMERLVIPYLYGSYGTTSFGELYSKVIDKWFVKQGFPLKKEQKDIDYFEALYRKNVGKPFTLNLTEDIEKFDYINGGDCKFCAIGRESKMLRDSVLLSNIEAALNKHDRVMVTFGLGHALAIEPSLRKLLSHRK